MRPSPYVSNLSASLQAIRAHVAGSVLLPESRTFLSSLQHSLQDTSASQNLLRACCRLAQGFLEGIHGNDWKAPVVLLLVPSDPIEIETRNFLTRVQGGKITAQGHLNEGVKICAGLFLQGALEVFPEAKSKPFLRATARLWGKSVSPKESPLPRPIPDEIKIFSRQAGKMAGRIFREDFEAGYAGGLLKSVLNRRLHHRPVDQYLAVQGWFLGSIEHLRDIHGNERLVTVLRDRQASIMNRTLVNGQPDYPAQVIQDLSTKPGLPPHPQS